MSLSSFLRPQSNEPGLRGTLNRYSIPISVAVVIVAGACLYYAFSSGKPTVKAYYSVDDGATFFAQKVQIPPFDVDGKQAVGAMVYSCDGGKTKFVGYLYRYTPEGKDKAEEMLRTHRPGPPIGMEVKRPGSGDWVASMVRKPDRKAADGATIMTVKCPDGTGVPFMLNP